MSKTAFAQLVRDYAANRRLWPGRRPRLVIDRRAHLTPLQRLLSMTVERVR